MSSHLEEDECESKLSLVIRKVQEGKTHICITSITTDRTRDIHIVLTMNTLASGMQFFGRMEEEVGPRSIIVFNSNKKTVAIGKDKDNCCHHAKDVDTVFALIRQYPNIKVIVCCAHEKRIRESIPRLIVTASDTTSFTLEKRKIIIHIDEAHKYMVENRLYIRQFNSSNIVKSIIGYSGSAKPIWLQDIQDPLFHKILIRDIEEELQIMRSPQYHGMPQCDHVIVEAEDITNEFLIREANINPEISIFAWIQADMTEKNCPTWYGERSIFDLGNELLFLSYLSYILPRMEIPQDRFSYNFAPAYMRKATHYQTVEIILREYPKANVIVINGNGMVLFRQGRGIIPGTKISKNVNSDKKIRQSATPEEINKLLEPSYMIQKLIEKTPNYPTFVTGQQCVNMSVTLINQTIGNFDNVIIAHQHFSSVRLYQQCRFMFNYSNWDPENIARINITKLWSLTKSVIDECINYEEDTDRMSREFSGKTCSMREIDGMEPEDPSERELKREALKAITLHNPLDLWKKMKVYDGNDEEQWARVNTLFKDKMGKDIPSRSRPKQMDPNTKEPSPFYHCSTTATVGIQTTNTIKQCFGQSWWSTFQLLPDKLDYARIFVGYDDLEDPSEYTIYVKCAQLQDCPETRATLSRYGKRATSSSSSSEEDDSI